MYTKTMKLINDSWWCYNLYKNDKINTRTYTRDTIMSILRNLSLFTQLQETVIE